MKKLTIVTLSILLLSFFIPMVSCNEKSPAPAAPSGRIQAMDATTTPMVTTSPTPACVVPNPSGTFPQISTSFSSDKCGGASPAVTFEINSLDPPYDYVVVNGTAEEGTTGNVINGASHAVYFANFSLPPGYWEGSNGTVVGYIEIYQGTNITNVPLCINGSVLYSIPVERGTAGVYSNQVQFALPKGSLQAGNNTVSFDVPLSPPNTGIVCIWDMNGCLMPVPTSTPGTPTVVATKTPTNTPTPTKTFTPSPTPTCPGGNYSANITPYTQFNPSWQATPMDHDVAGPVTTSTGQVFIDPHTIRSDGCLMTCLSMLAGQTPPSVDTTLTTDNIIGPTGNLDPEAAATDLGFTLNGTTINASDGDVTAALKNNDFAIAVVNHNGRQHYVVVTGAAFNSAIGDCDFTIQDPGSSTHHFLSDYDLSMVMGLTRN